MYITDKILNDRVIGVRPWTFFDDLIFANNKPIFYLTPRIEQCTDSITLHKIERCRFLPEIKTVVKKQKLNSKTESKPHDII